MAQPPSGLVKARENFFRRTERNIAYYLINAFRIYVIHFGGCLLIILFFLFLMSTPFMDRAENIFLDFSFRQRPLIKVHPAIAFIDMDEESIQGIGRWPWPRYNHAALVHILNEWNARSIVFDVLFSEPSTTFDDESLIESLQEKGNVYLPVMLESFREEKKWTHPLSEFEKYAKGTGHINIYPDRDGVIRHIEPYLGEGGQAYPHLSLKVAYDYLGSPVPPRDALSFPLDSKQKMLINWAGKWATTFDHYPYVEIIKSYAAIREGRSPAIPPEKLKDKICIIGLTASGLVDIKPNPLESTYPAVGVHANVINSILTNQFVYPAPFRWNQIALVLIGLLASVFFFFSKKIVSFIAGLGLGMMWLGVSFFLFVQQGIWLYAVTPLLLIFSLFVFSAVFSLIAGKKEQDRLFALATRDGLTGLFVIRHFRTLLNHAVVEAHRKKEPLSLILIDLDFFKKVNDTYGHVAGDVVLKRVAKILQESVKKEGVPPDRNIPARYGGEEMIIMFKNCSLTDAAFNYGEAIRRAVEAEVIEYENVKIHQTISMGVATLHPEETVPDLMVHRADTALYRAKETGRNRVCIEKPETSPETPAA